MKKIAIGIVSVLAGVGLIIGTASAWTFNVSGVGVCNVQTGQYDLTWSIENPEPEVATIAQSDRASVSGTIPQQSTETYTESVPGTSTGESLTVRLEWPSDKGQPAKTADIVLAGDCKPPKVTPPKDTPKKEVPKEVKKESAPSIEFVGPGK